MAMLNRMSMREDDIVELIQDKAIHVKGYDTLDQLIDRIGNKRIVMLGEGSHGTHEYYTWRNYITKKLISQKGFDFIAVEGDWPDCYNINCYVKGSGDLENASSVLKKFDRWPTWMWSNWEIAAVAEWLRSHNKIAAKEAGFYGLDVYSLWESLDVVKSFLEKQAPEELERIRETFSCFEPYKGDETSYAYATRLVPELCENEVLALLQQIQQKVTGNLLQEEHIFSAEQNAIIAVNAEKYYRSMVSSDANSWNIRDSHMQETLDRLLDFHGPESKAIVWAHNTHIGDASATDMADEGMFNIGELARAKYKDDVYLVGFGSYSGSVIAGKSWGAPMQTMFMVRCQTG